MVSLTTLDEHIERTQVELQGALTRLKGFTELQQSLAGANVGLQEGGEALSKLSEHLAMTTQTLTSTLSEFKAAIEAMRAATPEALSHNLDTVMDATQRTEQSFDTFQGQLKEEIAEQRESLERRVHAVEAGLEQTRRNLEQIKNWADERLDQVQAGGRRSSGWILLWVILTFLLLLGTSIAQFQPELTALLGGA